jgi:hypothetical protein
MRTAHRAACLLALLALAGCKAGNRAPATKAAASASTPSAPGLPWLAEADRFYKSALADKAPARPPFGRIRTQATRNKRRRRTYLMIVPPHWFGTPPPPHVWPAGHVPQSGVSPPHPSATCPQLALACWHVRGTQVVWHVPLLQDLFGPHWPQSVVRPPHPSATWPHVAPRLAQVAGVHVTEPH